MNREALEDLYVQVGSIRVRYRRAGQGGPKVLLVHGIGGSVATDWSRNLEALGESCEVYGLDLAGHGLSDKPADFSYTAQGYTSFLAAFMDKVGLERVSLAGLSMGGGLVLRFALDHPERVEKLVLVDCLGLGREVHPGFRLLSLPVPRCLLSLFRKRGAGQSWRGFVYDPAVVTREITDLNAEYAKSPGFWRALKATIRGGCGIRGIKSGLWRPIVAGLPSIAAPTLIIWGRQDPVFPLRHAFLAKESIPGARLHIFEKCGHLPQFERAEEFNRLVGEFLGSGCGA